MDETVSRTEYSPMGGSLLKEKAKAFAKELGIEFSASEGWLTNFKKRNGIVFKKKCAGKAQASTLTFVLCGRTRFRALTFSTRMKPDSFSSVCQKKHLHSRKKNAMEENIAKRD
ncbi:hypothetical protein TNCV_3228691 [Trichonephila clavipes]|nr:hypothetical protein TNCV_3228691 [Trichonephila clavipes]